MKEIMTALDTAFSQSQICEDKASTRSDNNLNSNTLRCPRTPTVVDRLKTGEHLNWHMVGIFLRDVNWFTLICRESDYRVRAGSGA
jgi:hypothetical protein